jgi:acetylornithine/N-succinyldiaminopimelate aminotransferase
MSNTEIIAATDAVQVGVYARFPVAFVKGSGARLWDADGKEYLDFFSGLAVNNLGHAHPAVVAAVSEQAGRLFHTSNVYYSEPASRLGRMLVDRSFADRVFFSNSGAEANEAAIKLARKFGADHRGGRYELLTVLGSFHGRTLATLSATAQEKYQRGFQPLVPGFRYVAYGDAKAMTEAVRDETIGILIEPIQGEGGVVVPPDGYFRELRELCDRKGMLLLFDEVQTGIGRTGSLFAYEQLGIEPDIMTLAKALGGGLPIGAMLAKGEIAAALGPGTHGSTFGGNPVSCAAGVAVLETLADGSLLANVRRQGERIVARMRALAKRLAMIKDVRGRGLILGIELDRDGRPVVAAALERGLVVNCTNERVIRLLPPLVLTDEDTDRGLDVLEQVLVEYGAKS